MNLNELAEEFDKVMDSATNRLSEEKFKQFFLPYFIGEKSHDNIIVKWMEIAGSPLMQVHLVNDEGEVVNTIPPLIKGGIEEGTDIDNLLVVGKTKEMVMGSSPEFRKITSKLSEKVAGLENVEAWAQALSKYVDVKEDDIDETEFIDDNDDEYELDFS